MGKGTNTGEIVCSRTLTYGGARIRHSFAAVGLLYRAVQPELYKRIVGESYLRR